jgi:hypothetical protein
MSKRVQLSTAPADPQLWSAQSQRSVSAAWTKDYRDIEYKCCRCGAPSVFTAQDQKYTFEVKKAPIDQRRTLCENCWRRSLEIARELGVNAERWAREKPELTKDREFLEAWLRLLEQQEQYVAYRPDTAKKNMLRKLLNEV